MEKNKEVVYSKNERAEKIVGLRGDGGRINGIIFGQPCELGYHCPVCKYDLYNEKYGVYDERLEWSEYNGFLWCSVCNFGYVTALCVPNLHTIEGCKKANEIFLNIIEDSNAAKK